MYRMAQFRPDQRSGWGDAMWTCPATGPDWSEGVTHELSVTRPVWQAFLAKRNEDGTINDDVYIGRDVGHAVTAGPPRATPA